MPDELLNLHYFVRQLDSKYVALNGVVLGGLVGEYSVQVLRAVW
jgi:hypothetical protein